VAAISNKWIGTRNYVSETKKDSAQVNIDTAIRTDQKAFFQETGKLPEHQTMQEPSVNADAMMSPIAGMLLMSAISGYSY
jgi:cysteine desulfurase